MLMKAKEVFFLSPKASQMLTNEEIWASLNELNEDQMAKSGMQMRQKMFCALLEPVEKGHGQPYKVL